MIIEGRVRAIGFGAPLFASEDCAQQVASGLNCRNLFNFFVSGSDAKRHWDPIPSALDDPQRFGFRALGKFVQLDEDDFWITANSPPQPLEGSNISDAVNFSYHALSVYAFLMSRSFLHGIILDFHPSAVCQINSLEQPSPGVGVELKENELWIRVNDCPLHVQRIELVGLECEPVSFPINDGERQLSVYTGPPRNIYSEAKKWIKDCDLPVGRSKAREYASKSQEAAKKLMPNRITTASLKINIPPEQRSKVEALIQAPKAKVKFITTIGKDYPKADIRNPTISNPDEYVSTTSSTLRIYHGMLLCALMELVLSEPGDRRSKLAKNPRMADLLTISNALGETEVHSFVNDTKVPQDRSEEALQLKLQRAHEVAETATKSLKIYMTKELEVKVKWSGWKKSVAAVCVVLFVAGAGVVVAISCGVAIPGVAAAGAAAEAGLITAGTASGGGAVAAVGSAVCGVSTLMSDENHVESQYEEKLKLLLKILNIEMPVRVAVDTLENSLAAGINSTERKSLKFNDLVLQEESVEMVKKMSAAIVCLRKLRTDCSKQTLIALVGCKNTGKSTAAKALFGLCTNDGAARATVFPSPYHWESESGNCKGLVIDFPGATEAKDATAQLANKFLGIGGTNAWCLLFVNPFTLGTPDCQLARSLKDHFNVNRILVICTKGDEKDANGNNHVVMFGGADKVRQYVVKTLNKKPFEVGISEKNVFVSSFVRGGEPNVIPLDVLHWDQVQKIVHNMIWPHLCDVWGDPLEDSKREEVEV